MATAAAVIIPDLLIPEIEKPYDVPKVLIYTNGETIGTEGYTDCDLVIVDEKGGQYKTIRDEESQYFFSGSYHVKFTINEPKLEDLTTEQFEYVKKLVKDAELALASRDMKEIEKYFDMESMASYTGLHAVNMPWFDALTRIPEFQGMVNDKFPSMQDVFVNLYEDNVNGQNHIDETIAAYQESINRNYGEAG